MRSRRIICDSDEEEESGLDSPSSSSSPGQRESLRDGRDQISLSLPLYTLDELESGVARGKSPIRGKFDASRALLSPSSEQPLADDITQDRATDSFKTTQKGVKPTRKRSRSEIVGSPRKKLKSKATTKRAASAPRDEWEVPGSSASHNKEDWSHEVRFPPRKVRSRSAIKDNIFVEDDNKHVRRSKADEDVRLREEESDAWKPREDVVVPEAYVKKRTSRRNGKAGLLEGLGKPRRQRKASTRDHTSAGDAQSTNSKSNQHHNGHLPGHSGSTLVDLTSEGDNAMPQDGGGEEAGQAETLVAPSDDVEACLTGSEADAAHAKPKVEVHIVRPVKRRRPKTSKESFASVSIKHERGRGDQTVPPDLVPAFVRGPGEDEADEDTVGNADAQTLDPKPVSQVNTSKHEICSRRRDALAEVEDNCRSIPLPKHTSRRSLSQDSKEEQTTSGEPLLPPHTPPKPTASGGEKHAQKKDSHSPLNSAKVPLRVGLSKRAKIQPLLRIVKK